MVGQPSPPSIPRALASCETETLFPLDSNSSPHPPEATILFPILTEYAKDDLPEEVRSIVLLYLVYVT